MLIGQLQYINVMYKCASLSLKNGSCTTQSNADYLADHMASLPKDHLNENGLTNENLLAIPVGMI